MTKRIQPSEPTVPRVRPTEPTVERIDPQAVAKALGGEPCPERIARGASPITIYGLRQEMLRRRQSSGGRPGLEGTDFRAKIPVADQEWRQLEDLATAMSAEGFSPSAGQVASVLLSLALRSVVSDKAEAIPSAAVLRELVASGAAEKSR